MKRDTRKRKASSNLYKNSIIILVTVGSPSVSVCVFRGCGHLSLKCAFGKTCIAELNTKKKYILKCDCKTKLMTSSEAWYYNWSPPFLGMTSWEFFIPKLARVMVEHLAFFTEYNFLAFISALYIVKSTSQRSRTVHCVWHWWIFNVF